MSSFDPMLALLLAAAALLAAGLAAAVLRRRRSRPLPPDRPADPPPLRLHLDIDDAGRLLPQPAPDPSLTPCPRCGRLAPGPVGRRYCPADDLHF